MKNCSSPKIVRRGFKKKEEPNKAHKWRKASKKRTTKRGWRGSSKKNVKYSIKRCGKSTPFFSLKGKDPARNARFQVGYRAF